MDSKSILTSKTFWFNAFALAATAGGVLPPKFGVPVVAIANIGLRVITNQPVSIFPPESDGK